jgi:hypothetical protein
MKSILKGVVAALAFFGIVSTASAEIVYVTYSGTVVAGSDLIGIFGTPGSSLAGYAYTTSYIFNTSVGTIQSDPFYNTAYGGIGYAQPSPSLGAVLTINGVSFAVGGASFGQLYGIDFGDFSRSYDFAGDALGTIAGRSVFNQMSDPSRTIPVSINTPFTYTATSGGQGQALIYINPLNGAGDLIDLAPTTETVSVPGAVPEPSTWAMMLLGFAGLGFVFRHSARQAL